MEVWRASGAETEEEKRKEKKDRKQSSGAAELWRGRQRERWSFGEICRCAAGLRLAGVVTCAAAAALFSH